MPGVILREGTMLRGLQWSFEQNTGSPNSIHRLTLYWHDNNGPVLTCYANAKAVFDNNAFQNALLIKDTIEAVYVIGDSAPHKAIHALQDVSEGKPEDSTTADPHTHLQALKTAYPEDSQLEGALKGMIRQLATLQLLAQEEAESCIEYFQENGWA